MESSRANRHKFTDESMPTTATVKTPASFVDMAPVIESPVASNQVHQMAANGLGDCLINMFQDMKVAATKNIRGASRRNSRLLAVSALSISSPKEKRDP